MDDTDKTFLITAMLPDRVGILRDITGEAALDIPEDELFALMADAAGFNLA